MRARTRKTTNKKAERVVYFKIPTAEYEALRRIADSDERPVSAVLRRFVREAIARGAAA